MTHGQLILRHVGIGLGATVAILLLAMWQVLPRLSAGWILIAWIAAITPVTFLYYGFDKWRAKNDGQRVPEAALLIFGLAGGSLGAYAGMKWFRHKTIKGRFLILFWGIVVLQVAAAALIIKESL